jgi:phosphoribosyl 1,2-cyclic phosphodiesterase
MRCGQHLFVFDSGTGIRYLGDSLSNDEPLSLDLYLTHTHHDHIIGLPFFGPIFEEKNRVQVWAGHLQPELTLTGVLCQFMKPPLFPVPPQIFGADVSFNDFKAGETLSPGPEVTVRTAVLNHPNGATGYRVEFDGRAICYVTDTEHVPGEPDENVLRLIDGADILIYDSTYTDDEFPRYVSWGHSTWQEGVRLCDQAGVKRLVIFHHDPGHDDDFMDEVAKAADACRPGTTVAREGLVLRP